VKVLHVIPSISMIRGGPSLAVIEIVKYLCLEGVDTEIATTNDSGPDLLDVPLGFLQDYKGVRVRFFSRFSPFISIVREFGFTVGLTLWLWQHLRDYDVVHIHAIFSYPSTIAMAIARIQNIPYFVSPHGMLCDWSLQQGRLKKLVYLSLIERINLDCSQSIILNSTQEQKELEVLGWNLSSIIVPHGLELLTPIANAREKLHQMLNIPLETPVILFLSRLHPKKGLDYLIPALAKLRDLVHGRNSNFAFVLAGSGSVEYETELDCLLQKNNLVDCTYKLGFVEGDKKNICLQGADLYVLTSHSENFGISVLEALASGTPALVTPGVALADLVKSQNLGWVVQLEVEGIAATIQEILESPDTIKQKGDRATEYVIENYSWGRIAASLLKIYREYGRKVF
jgi:glycosyltransferase involved in cell wall biosynthesis